MVPLHPQIVHLPLALAVVLPILALACALGVRKGSFTPATWLLVVALQVLATGGGYWALSTGEGDEKEVRQVTGKAPLEEHEERAEMFVAGSVAATGLALMTIFVGTRLRLPLQLACAALMAGNTALAVAAGKTGGRLVYVHGAAQARSLAQSKPVEKHGEGLLPTPGMNTSESEHPRDEGEPAPAPTPEVEELDEAEPEE